MTPEAAAKRRKEALSALREARDAAARASTAHRRVGDEGTGAAFAALSHDIDNLIEGGHRAELWSRSELES